MSFLTSRRLAWQKLTRKGLLVVRVIAGLRWGQLVHSCVVSVSLLH